MFSFDERKAIAAVKKQGDIEVSPGDVIVLAGCGPAGTGMEETYQLDCRTETLAVGQTRNFAHRRTIFRRIDRRVRRAHWA